LVLPRRIRSTSLRQLPLPGQLAWLGEVLRPSGLGLLLGLLLVLPAWRILAGQEAGSMPQSWPAALGNPFLDDGIQGGSPAMTTQWGAALPAISGPGQAASGWDADSERARAIFGNLPPQDLVRANSQGWGPPVGGMAPGGFGQGGLPQSSNAAAGLDRNGDPVQVQIFPRNAGVDLNVRNVPGRIPGEQMILATGGVRVVIDSPLLGEVDFRSGPAPANQRLIIQADHLVAWTSRLSFLGGSDQSPRWELFLEGNVIFAMGQRVVYANRMYYDVNQNRGTILDAEMLSPVADYEGLIRFRADVLQQIDPQQFRAYGAAATTSRMGVPRYWFSSREIDLTRTQSLAVDPQTGATRLDPATGQPMIEDQFMLDSYDNFINVFGRRVLYWPVFRTDLDNPQYYLENFAVGNDRIFGFQVRSRWNMNQVLGLTPAQGTKWTGALDYLSRRGPAVGSRVSYDRDSGFLFPGPTKGFYDSWFLFNDAGRDNLGFDRRNVIPEATQRGRALWRHDHRFLNGDRLLAEFGWISDRNFLEQFYEREWDEEKDQATSVRLQRLRDNRLFEVGGDANLNPFFTQTQWLPRADLSIIGQPVFGTPLTWYAKTHVGYADLRVADAPTNLVDLAKFDLLAWEAEREGLRGGTRQELEFPVQMGPLKVVPYALGDVTYWGQDLAGDAVTRLYGQGGIRSSLPLWTVDSSVQSQLFNVNGLAHKITFETDFLYADADQDLDRFPLYDPLDDDAQEHFRRRFAFDTFGLLPGQNVPIEFDERFFALRSGLQRYVSSPATEIADDLMLVRLGIHQRWQTKRGVPGRQRVIDWITFNMNGHFFPKSERDNFGKDFGMLDYNFRWHVGDRVAMLSDGYMDTFQDGLRTASIGMAANRPEVGDVYVGFRSIDGPINSKTVNLRMNYRLSHQWVLRGSNSWDFGNTGRIGQTLGATYIGESFLWHAGGNIDYSRDNVGFIFSVEPRGVPGGRLGRLGGVMIPPPGLMGLE